MGKKNNKGIIILMAVIILILVVLCILFATNTIIFNHKEIKNEVQNQENTSVKEDNTTKDITKAEDSIVEFDVDKLNKIGRGDFNFVKRIFSGNNSFAITSEGKVLIGFEHYLTGFNKAKDIIVFSEMSSGDILYILDYSGQLYQYRLDNIEKNIFEVEKNEEYSKIKEIFEYETLKKNAGGCMRLVVIDNNDNYKEISTNCV